MASSGSSALVPINISDKFGTRYTLTSTATGFTGSLSKFGFEADLSSVSPALGVSENNISWDFGDGHKTSGLSASHIYNFPGEYTVTCTVFDKDGDPHPSSTSRTVAIYNYFADEVVWRTDNIMASLTETVTAGRLSNPLTVERYNSWQSYNALSATGYTINVYASGSDSNYVSRDQYLTDKNIHFQKTWRFVESDQQLAPLSSIATTDNLLYFKTISAPEAGGTLVQTTSSDSSAIFTGTSGHGIVYYIDDSPSSQVNLFADLNTGNFPTFINSTFNIPRQNFINLDIDYYRSKPSVLPVVVEENVPDHLLITSTGIPGFSIGHNKFEKSPIVYTISIADSDDNLVKYFPGLSAGCEGSYYQLEHNFVNTPFDRTSYYSNSSITFQQYGALSLFAVVTGSTLNEYITASMVVPDGGSGNILLTGQSNTFNVWPASGQYHAEKYGENYDFSETIKSYILQDTISEKSNFVNWFMAEIFGTNLSDSESFGKTIYEKIDELPHNISDVDVANVDALYSMAKFVDLNFDDYRYNFPAGIKRLVDLLSINQSRLFGFRDNSNKDFDKSGYTLNDTTTYGKNLGTILDTDTYLVSAGTPIIANQLFGNQLKYVNTMVISGSDTANAYSSTYAGLTSYPLSGYDESWGWGLSIPSGESVSKYYDFYSYIDNATIGVSAFGIINGVIDFTSTQTTLEISDNVVTNWSSQYGIVDNMFDHRLREGLKLFNPDASTFIEVISGTDGDDCNPPTPTPTPTLTVTPSITPTNTPTPTVTPSFTPTPSVTPTTGLDEWEAQDIIWDNATSNWENA